MYLFLDLSRTSRVLDLLGEYHAILAEIKAEIKQLHYK